MCKLNCSMRTTAVAITIINPRVTTPTTTMSARPPYVVPEILLPPLPFRTPRRLQAPICPASPSCPHCRAFLCFQHCHLSLGSTRTRTSCHTNSHGPSHRRIMGINHSPMNTSRHLSKSRVRRIIHSNSMTTRTSTALIIIAIPPPAASGLAPVLGGEDFETRCKKDEG